MFNNSFADSNPKLALKIPPLNNLYLQYIIAAFIFVKKIAINEAEFQTALFAFERNKTCGYDEFRQM